MASSANAKVVMLPGDLPAAVGAILAPPGKAKG